MFHSHRCFSFFSSLSLSLSLLLINYFAFYIIVYRQIVFFPLIENEISNFNDFFFIVSSRYNGWKFDLNEGNEITFLHPDEDYSFEEREKKKKDKRAMFKWLVIFVLCTTDPFFDGRLLCISSIGPIKYAKRVTSEAWCMEILTSLCDTSLLSDLTLSLSLSRYYSLYDANFYRCSR